MTKIEAETVLVKAVQCGCNGVIKQLCDDWWRVYISKDGRWTFAVDMEDFEDSMKFPEFWAEGDF